jgi:hypothetical protein
LVRLFNPRAEKWNEHFRWSRDGTRLEGRTPQGRATVVALDVNNDLVRRARRLWLKVHLLP